MREAEVWFVALIYQLKGIEDAALRISAAIDDPDSPATIVTEALLQERIKDRVRETLVIVRSDVDKDTTRLG